MIVLVGARDQVDAAESRRDAKKETLNSLERELESLKNSAVN